MLIDDGDAPPSINFRTQPSTLKSFTSSSPQSWSYRGALVPVVGDHDPKKSSDFQIMTSHQSAFRNAWRQYSANKQTYRRSLSWIHWDIARPIRCRYSLYSYRTAMLPWDRIPFRFAVRAHPIPFEDPEVVDYSLSYRQVFLNGLNRQGEARQAGVSFSYPAYYFCSLYPRNKLFVWCITHRTFVARILPW